MLRMLGNQKNNALNRLSKSFMANTYNIYQCIRYADHKKAGTTGQEFGGNT